MKFISHAFPFNFKNYERKILEKGIKTMRITELYKQINRENSFEKMNFESLHKEMEKELDDIDAPITTTYLFLLSNYMLDEYNSLKEELEIVKANATALANTSQYEDDGETE